MNDHSPHPPQHPHKLPTHGQLFKATLIALAIATLLLVTVVLPAEYGIDPTGAGKRLGLDGMGKNGNSKPAAPAAAVVPAPATAPTSANAASSGTASPNSGASEPTVVRRDTPFRSDAMSITLQPGKGAEIKTAMSAGDHFVFTWSAEGGPVNFDMHGERPNAGDEFTSYWKDKAKSQGHGSFTAPFAGSHGWFWANKGTAPVTVTVKVSGFYEKLYRP